MLFAATSSGRAGAGASHPLWHLAVVAAAPAVIIAGLKLHDRLRYRIARAAPRQSPRRYRPETVVAVAAVASALAGLIHASVCPAHFREGLLLGAFFLVAASGQMAWSALVLRSAQPHLFRWAAVGNGVIVVLWVWTRAAGLPFGLDAREPLGWLDAAATILEAAVVGLAVLVLRTNATVVGGSGAADSAVATR
jgi:hypothetical protein